MENLTIFSPTQPMTNSTFKFRQPQVLLTTQTNRDIDSPFLLQGQLLLYDSDHLKSIHLGSLGYLLRPMPTNYDRY